jgi:hypothetical protein
MMIDLMMIKITGMPFNDNRMLIRTTRIVCRRTIRQIVFGIEVFGIGIKGSRRNRRNRRSLLNICFARNLLVRSWIGKKLL